VTAETATAAEALLAELDAAAFGRDPVPLPAAAERAYEVFRCISREARSARRRMARVAPLAVLALSYSMVALAAPGTADDARLFAQGVAAYEAGQYGQAAATFRSVAGRLPRAADAWANAGTAAWASADTTNAVFGWQRALRLEPLAADARERLSLVASGDGHAAGTVPQVPPTPIALAAAALWLFAWALVAYRIRRVRVGGMSLAAGLGVAAIAFGGAVFAIDRRLAARDLAVVGRTSWLREIPALGSQRLDRLRGGEVARVLERRAEWSRVSSGANEGWVETGALLSLARE
jgi:tetratricopeptide (TPR) repeat protein